MGRETGKGKQLGECYQNQSCGRTWELVCNTYLGVMQLRKQICCLLPRAAESGERSIKLVPLCLQPAFHIGRMDPVARESSQAESQWLELEVRLARTEKDAEGTWMGCWQHQLQDIAFELNHEGWVAPKREAKHVSHGEEGMAGAEDERQPCYIQCVQENSEEGIEWMEMK